MTDMDDLYSKKLKMKRDYSSIYFRIIELEEKAKNKYIDCIEWNLVIKMLEESEEMEYYKLQKRLEELRNEINKMQ